MTYDYEIYTFGLCAYKIVSIIWFQDQMLLAVPSNDQSWNWLSLEALLPSRWLSGESTSFSAINIDVLIRITSQTRGMKKNS